MRERGRRGLGAGALGTLECRSVAVLVLEREAEGEKRRQSVGVVKKKERQFNSGRQNGKTEHTLANKKTTPFVR